MASGPGMGQAAPHMPRSVLAEDAIHDTVRERVANWNREIVDEVSAAIEANPIVVVGMRQNPHPKKARKLLDAVGIPYAYLEYGSYFGDWRRRSALKMWTGWPTFPMIFIEGQLIGGASDLEAMINAGALKHLRS